MIKNFLDAVEENYLSAMMILLFLFALVGITAATINSMSEDKVSVEMAKLGCTQQVSWNEHMNTKYWVCPSGVQESK